MNSIIQDVRRGAGVVLTDEEVTEVAAKVAAKAPANSRYYAFRAGRNAALDKQRSIRAARRAEVRAKAKERAQAQERARTRLFLAVLERAIAKVAALDFPRQEHKEALLDKAFGVGLEYIPAPSMDCAYQWVTRALKYAERQLAPEEIAALRASPWEIRRAREVCDA